MDRCGYREESLMHALWKCNFSNQVWKQSIWRSYEPSNLSFSEFLDTLVHNSSCPDLELFAYMVWLLWGERNNFLHGKKFSLKPDLIITQTFRLHKEFLDVNSFEKPQKANRRRSWTPPPHGIFKLNTDGAVSEGVSRRGLGAVVRNEKGELLGAFAQPISGNFSPLVTELMALKSGIKFVLDAGIIPSIVEVDSLEVVKLINAEECSWFEVRVLVEEIKALMPAVGTDKVVFSPRECNKVAHNVAKSIVYENSVFSCNEIGPLWLMESIANDSASCNPLLNQ